MLKLQHISKEYKTASLTQRALNDVSLTLRDNEFVAILGPSGSGKTTLLNIIGGLDRYDSGDLIINSVSTKKYRDRDWDSYRNHSVGFVFQSYNLIEHQSILANVELALTISGMRRKERRERAREALIRVGLEEHLHKKPNQLSGGQMQRVAIARALVNNPKILLADEPTGALDTETSVQVMELLKEVAHDRLVVMVTHNPELAEAYATRIVRLCDGEITGDSAPVEAKDEEEVQHKNFGRASMSFFTALSLSFKNLLTKKARTVLTSFAGSIGIIGIALILSLSQGVHNYINDIQKDTMTSYPLSVQAQTIDLSSIFAAGQSSVTDTEIDHELNAVYSNTDGFELASVASTSLTENNLTKFKQYLEDPESEVQNYIGENGVVYTYDTKFSLYTHDENGFLVNTDGSTLSEKQSLTGAVVGGMSQMTQNMTSTPSAGAMTGLSSVSSLGSMDSLTAASRTSAAEQMMPNRAGEGISPAITDNYEMLAGQWPAAYDEAVLVVDKNHEISAATLYQLGFLPTDEYRELIQKLEDQEDLDLDTVEFSYDEIFKKEFSLLAACDLYEQDSDGNYQSISSDNAKVEAHLEEALRLKIVGVICPTGDQSFLSAPIAYTQALTDYLMEHTDESEIVRAQTASPEINVTSGLSFEPESDNEKIADTVSYLTNLGVSEKAAFFDQLTALSALSSGTNAAQDALSSAGDLSQSQAAGAPGAEGMTQMDASAATLDETAKAAMLDAYLQESHDEELLQIYELYISPGSYEDNLTAFGVVSPDAPSSVSIYVDSFEDKDAVSDCIEDYNRTVSEADQIHYTDFVGLLMSSMTTIIDVISYVLIAFVSVSLVVSSIMIGIITYISVLERTKEIGILRAIGASKRNISQVFNAETFMIGSLAGVFGVGLTLLLLIPINAVIHALSGITTIHATLPANAAVILVVLSMLLTIFSGLIPAKKAAKKDPVKALRSE